MRAILAPFALIFLLLLPGCLTTPAPETSREKLVAAETAFQTALKTVRSIDKAGRLKPDDTIRLATAIRAARAALDAWHESPDLTDSGTAALSALRALRLILDDLSGEAT